MKLTIHPELQHLEGIPALTEDEYQRLEESVRKYGCQDPIKVWEHDGSTIILDGHNRFAICSEHNLPFTTCAVQGIEDIEDAQIWVLNNQLGRRNLIAAQRIAVIRDLKSRIAKKGEERMKAGVKNPKEIFPEGQTRDALGKLAGVSGKTFEKADKVLSEGDEATKAAMLKGDISINKAHKKVTGEKPKGIKDSRIAERNRAKQALKEHEEKTRMSDDFKKAWDAFLEQVLIAREEGYEATSRESIGACLSELSLTIGWED